MIIRSIIVNLESNEGENEVLGHANQIRYDSGTWTINGIFYPRFAKLMSDLSVMIRENNARVKP